LCRAFCGALEARLVFSRSTIVELPPCLGGHAVFAVPLLRWLCNITATYSISCVAVDISAAVRSLQLILLLSSIMSDTFVVEPDAIVSAVAGYLVMPVQYFW
jgi:hypothetical protein